MTDAPDLEFFDCAKQRARLSTAGCAKMWRKANGGEYRVGTWEALHHCKACSIGAANAGETVVADGFSELVADIQRHCPRCRRLAPRLINGQFCISCYNRSREARIGKNAKGHPPVQLLSRLHRMSVLVHESGTARIVSRLVLDFEELAIATARTATAPLTFSRAPVDPYVIAAGAQPDDRSDAPNNRAADRFIARKEAAALMKCSVVLLQRRMALPGGPATEVFGGKRWILREPFSKWLATWQAERQQPESEDDGALSGREAARAAGVAAWKLADLRRKGRGPPFSRNGRGEPRYPRESFMEWLAARRDAAQSDRRAAT